MGEDADDSTTVDISLRPEDDTISVGERTAVAVVVENGTEGVSAFEINLERESDAIDIVDLLLTEDPTIPSMHFDEGSATVGAAMGPAPNPFDPADLITIGEVTVEGTEPGTTGLNCVETAKVAPISSAGDQYEIGDCQGASITVTE